MKTADLVTRIQAREPVLRRIGVRSLALFGSQARGEASAESDVDVLYEFEDGAATLDHFVQLQDELEEAAGRRVDLVSVRHLGPSLALRIREAMLPVLGSR